MSNANVTLALRNLPGISRIADATKLYEFALPYCASDEEKCVLSGAVNEAIQRISACATCKGRGRVTCLHCKGDGKTDCHTCDGSGQADNDEEVPCEL